MGKFLVQLMPANASDCVTYCSIFLSVLASVCSGVSVLCVEFGISPMGSDMKQSCLSMEMTKQDQTTSLQVVPLPPGDTLVAYETLKRNVKEVKVDMKGCSKSV